MNKKPLQELTVQQVMRLVRELRTKAGDSQSEAARAVAAGQGLRVDRHQISNAERQPLPRYDYVRTAMLRHYTGEAWEHGAVVVWRKA